MCWSNCRCREFTLGLVGEIVHGEAFDDGPAESLLHARRVTKRVVGPQLDGRHPGRVLGARSAGQAAALA